MCMYVYTYYIPMCMYTCIYLYVYAWMCMFKVKCTRICLADTECENIYTYIH